MNRIILIVILVAASSSMGLAQSSKHETANLGKRKEASVRKFIDNFAAAFSQNDVQTLEQATSADYSFVAPNGEIQDRVKRYAPIRSGDLKYTSVKYTDVTVRLYGSTAVVTATVDVNSRLNGNDFSGKFRSTLTLVLVKGLWMLVASQANKI